MSPTEPDPLGTARLRDAVLRAWRDSPTRFTEDANAEEDLRLGGYADRLFVELAQNAADAAAIAGVAGRLRVRMVGRELRVANTGAPLDPAGVAALASLRASAKRHGVTVGRFGVGFAAVLTVTAEPRVVSRTGGVVFSERRTAEIAGDMTELARQYSHRGGAVPVLRLVWPAPDDEEPVAEGFDTEVRLPLADGVDADALLEEIRADVDDVLLAMPVFERIEIDDRTWTRTADANAVEITRAGDEPRRWLVHAVSGEFTADEAATLGIEAAKHPAWSVLWALPVDVGGVPSALGEDVLHAPTPTDERLSLPARLIAAVPIEPSRRRVMSGPAVTAVLRAAATAYPDLVRLVADDHRPNLAPQRGFPLSEVDAALHDLIARRLTDEAWLPPAAGGAPLSGARARVLEVDAPDLVAVLADTVPGLAAACGPDAVGLLGTVGAGRLAVRDAVDEAAGVRRPAQWWRDLYDALLKLLDGHTVDAEELSGLGVPLLDGRTSPGARGVLLPDPGTALPDELIDRAGIVGLRVASADARHPLLERLGAVRADAAALLDEPALRAAVERSVDDAAAGLDTAALAELVLHLVGEAGDGRPWLGALALPGADGAIRRAGELLLPSSPLLGVFDADEIGGDGAVAVVDDAIAERWPAETLTSVGVLDAFAVLSEPDPAGPHDDLPDSDEWWQSLDEPPAELVAVRDLDLVADDAWPAALRLLASRPETRRALTDPRGHTGWWIARFGLLGRRPPREWRLPGCAELAGLYDPAPDVGLGVDVLAAAGVRGEPQVEDADDAADLLERLADPARTPQPGVVLRAYERLADADVDVSGMDPPDAVRAMDGSIADADRAAVLDAPWLLEVADPAVLVATGTAAPDRLADLLDLPLASEVITGEVVSDGEVIAWSDLAAVRAAAELAGAGVPSGVVRMHSGLEVRVDRAERAVRWWVDADGDVHADDSDQGLARAFAHVAGRWEQRHLLADLIADPSAGTLLG